MGRSPHGQEDVEHEIIELLQHGRIMTTQEITTAVKKRLVLAPADLERANKRDNEVKIDQIIANALQVKRHLCRDGLVKRTGRGEFRITDAGRRHFQDQQARVAEMGKILDEMLKGRELG